MGLDWVPLLCQLKNPKEIFDAQEVASEKSQAALTESVAEGRHSLRVKKHTHTLQTQRKGSVHSRGGWENRTSSLLQRAGGFKAPEESSSPALGLVSGLKTRGLIGPQLLCDDELIWPFRQWGAGGTQKPAGGCGRENLSQD